MLKPIRMKKFSALILDEKKDDVLRELKERGIIQFFDISDDPSLRGFELASVPPSHIRARASELLSKVDNVLDAFQLVESTKPILKNFIQEEVEKTPVSEIPAPEFFEDIEGKVHAVGEKVAQISSRLEEMKKEREELINSRDVLSMLQRLGVGPKDLEKYRSVCMVVGVVPSKEVERLKIEIGETAGDCLFYSSLDKKDALILTVFFREYEVDVTKILRMHHFEESQIPPNIQGLGLEEASSKLEAGLASITKEEKRLLEELEKVASAEKDNFLRMKELLQVERYLEGVNALFGKTAKTYVLSGWVPSNRIDEIVRAVQKSSDGYCTISVEDPKKKDEPPTLLSNPAPAKPVEVLTNTYGSPSYNEIDPTEIVAITYPITFGLMFGDVGHGITLAILGYLLGFRLNIDKSIKRFGRILLLCGVAATFCGFLYGGVFGLEGLIHPLWISPLEDIPTLIVFSLTLGLILLSLGCILNIANKISHGKPLEGVLSPWGGVGIWLLWGGAFVVWKHGPDIFAIGGDIKTLIPAIFTPLLLICVGKKYLEGASLMWGFYESYDAVTRFLFNSISYVRVIVIAVVHSALCVMMTTIMAMFPATILGLVLKSATFLIGNLIIFIMEAFISFIQTLRLHYYEFFSKFYGGQGNKFTPFKVMRRYTFLVP